jgi:hypothetical protein
MYKSKQKFIVGTFTLYYSYFYSDYSILLLFNGYINNTFIIILFDVNLNYLKFLFNLYVPTQGGLNLP